MFIGSTTIAYSYNAFIIFYNNVKLKEKFIFFKYFIFKVYDKLVGIFLYINVLNIIC